MIYPKKWLFPKLYFSSVAVRTCIANLFSDSLQMNVEDEVRVGRDKIANRPVAISEVAGNIESGLLAELHGNNALVPTLDDLANTNLTAKAFARSVVRRVELLSLVVRLRGVLQPAGITHENGVLRLGRVAGAFFEDGLGELVGHCSKKWYSK